MKKLFFLILTIISLGFLFNFGNLVFAACATGTICIENPLEAESFGELINSIINFFFYIAMALVPLMIIISAFYFFTAGGNPQEIEKGKKLLFYTLIGLAIVLLAKALGALIGTLVK